MWALIMTVAFVSFDNIVTYSVSTLDNFPTEQSCINAGQQQETALLNLKTSKKYTFICVKK